MIEKKLNEILSNQNFKRISSNAEGVYFLFRFMNNEVEIISIMHAENGDEFTDAQYVHILEQMKNNFINRGVSKIHLLSLVFTREPDKVKKWCLQEEDNHWIISISTNQLLIYETQASVFTVVREGIEKILQEETRAVSGQYGTADNQYRETPKYRRKLKFFQKHRWLTPINILLVAVNIVVFILTYDMSPFYRIDSDGGALLWTAVLQDHEYYRFITAMFLHGDPGHIFNNMLVLLFIGDNLERAAGKIPYLFIYFGSGIIAGITSIGYNMMIGSERGSIGASGAIFGVVGAMLYVLIVNKGRLEDISSRQIAMFVILSLYGGMQSVQIDQAAHVGGFIGGMVLAVLFYRKKKNIRKL